MLNVGANKGYDVRSFIERFDASWNVSGHQWARSLMRHNTTGQLCGACGACSERPRWRSPSNVKMGTVLAVEAEPKNAELLGKVFEEHALHARDVRVLHAVATGPSAGVRESDFLCANYERDRHGDCTPGGREA